MLTVLENAHLFGMHCKNTANILLASLAAAVTHHLHAGSMMQTPQRATSQLQLKARALRRIDRAQLRRHKDASLGAEREEAGHLERHLPGR